MKHRFTRLDKYIWTHKKRRVSFRQPESPNRPSTSASSVKPFQGKGTVKEEDDASVERFENDKTSNIEAKDVENISNTVSGVEDLNDKDKCQNDDDNDGDIEEELREVTKDIDFEKIDKLNEEDSSSSTSDEDKKFK